MKRLLLAPLLIFITFPVLGSPQNSGLHLFGPQNKVPDPTLNLEFTGETELEVLYCAQEKYLTGSISEIWENYPWIYHKKTGELYKYDSFLNQIDFMKTDNVGEDFFTYESRLEGNILKIKEKVTNNGNVLDDRRYIIDIQEKKSTHFNVNNPDRKAIDSCIKLDLPKGVKINYK